MIRHLSIRWKLLGGFLLVALSSIVMMYINVSAQTQQEYYEELVRKSTAQIQAVLEMKSVAVEVDRRAATFAFAGVESTQSETSFGAAKKHALLASLEDLQRWEDDYKKGVDSNDPQSRSFGAQVSVARTDIVDAALEYINLKEQGADADRIRVAEQTLTTTIQSLRTLIDSSIVVARENARLAQEQSDVFADQALTENIIIAAVALCIATGLGVFLTITIARPIRRVRDAAFAIASGDFTKVIRVTAKDEIGELATVFNDMTKKLQSSHESLEEQVTKTQLQATTLAQQVDELGRLNKLMIDRELKMVELKQRIAELESRSSVQPPAPPTRVV